MANKTAQEKFLEALSQLKASISDLKEIRHPNVERLASQLETTAEELDRIPKDEYYWEDFE